MENASFNSDPTFKEMAVYFADMVASSFYKGKYYKEFEDCSIYDGLAGMALFHIELFRETGLPRFQNNALTFLENAWRHKNKLLNDPYTHLGFYSGWTGLAYAAIRIGRILNESSLIKRGLQLINRLHQFDLSKFSVDVTNGMAGALPALIKIYKYYPSSELNSLIHLIAEQILRKARKQDRGWSWKTMPSVLDHLTGHSHGVAGIATALLEMYAFTGNNRYYDAALNGLRYERSYYSPEHQNWPDFRIDPEDPTGDPKFPCCWCHGASGIALSRLRSYEITGDAGILNDAHLGIETIIERSSYVNRSNSSLCHGVLGNSDILLYASKVLDEKRLSDYAFANGVGGINKHYKRNRPWVNGIHDTAHIPGLMLGLSGIGYAYLRLSSPHTVPNIMLIHPDQLF